MTGAGFVIVFLSLRLAAAHWQSYCEGQARKRIQINILKLLHFIDLNDSSPRCGGVG